MKATNILHAAAVCALLAHAPVAFANALNSNQSVPVQNADTLPYNPDDYPTYKLEDISFRATALTGSDTPIIGGYLKVPNGYPHRILIRAVGPGLAKYGITTPNADPVLTVYAGQTVLAQNDNWETPETVDGGQAPASAGEIVAAEASVGAFKLMSGSTDAAVILTLGSGAYTAKLTSNQPGGIGLLEMYDLDWQTKPGGFINVSSRARVIAGQGASITGFVLNGHGDTHVLVRGVGPGLTPYGVSGVLPDPSLILSVFGGGLDHSVGAYNVMRVHEEVSGAFAIKQGSPDAAIDTIIGSWFAGAGFSSVLTSKSGSSGVALNEVYLFYWNNNAPVSTSGTPSTSMASTTSVPSGSSATTSTVVNVGSQ